MSMNSLRNRVVDGATAKRAGRHVVDERADMREMRLLAPAEGGPRLDAQGCLGLVEEHHEPVVAQHLRKRQHRAQPHRRIAPCELSQRPGQLWMFPIQCAQRDAECRRVRQKCLQLIRQVLIAAAGHRLRAVGDRQVSEVRRQRAISLQSCASRRVARWRPSR